jgi:hypothetical protein
MEPKVSEKIRILFLGLIGPAVLFYLLYAVLIRTEKFQTFDRLRNQYWSEFISGRADKGARVDLVVLGDSTAKTAFNPSLVDSPFGVNLGLNHGTGLTIYHMMETYLETRPAPKCILVLYQSNWRTNYSKFFSGVLFYHPFSWERVRRIWEIASEHGVFPADQIGAFEFWSKAVTAALQIDPFPLEDMQAAIWGRSELDLDLVHRAQMRTRGYFASRRMSPVHRAFFDDTLYPGFKEEFSPNESDDFYFARLLQLAEEKGFKVLHGPTPVPESEFEGATATFRKGRDAHLDEVFSRSTRSVRLNLPKSLPRDSFYDFFHFNVRGTEAVTEALRPSLSEHCR